MKERERERDAVKCTSLQRERGRNILLEITQYKYKCVIWPSKDFPLSFLLTDVRVIGINCQVRINHHKKKSSELHQNYKKVINWRTMKLCIFDVVLVQWKTYRQKEKTWPAKNKNKTKKPLSWGVSYKIITFRHISDNKIIFIKFSYDGFQWVS